MHYLRLKDDILGYHNLKLDEKLSCLTTFAFQFCRYRYLTFSADPAGGRFQRKIDEIFKELPNVFGIADDILVVGYNKDNTGHDAILQ